MVTSYTENPDNFYEVSELVESEAETIKEIFFSAKQIFFYDACSFQRHSNLPDEEKNILINYFKVRESAIFLTRCILMEISSDSHLLKDEFVCFLKALKANGIRIGIFDEEYTYDILSECFSTNEKVNEYLMLSVRTVKSPVGTIHKTLRLDKKLSAELIEGENLKQSGLYKKFFSAVRSNKERHDNLGEELMAVCINILSYMPGLNDGKLCVLTDDKGAVSKFHSVCCKKSYGGSKIIIFSTPKLVQHMYMDHIEISEIQMENLLTQGTCGNIVFWGISPFDLDVSRMSMSAIDLVHKILTPNEIKIVF